MKHWTASLHPFADNRGMTLIEIMVVVAIIGMITGLLTYKVMVIDADAKVKMTQVQLKKLGEALTLYKFKTGQYPSAEQSLVALIAADIIDEVPADGWGNPILYSQQANGYQLKSLGADRVEGGTDHNQDLVLNRDR